MESMGLGKKSEGNKDEEKRKEADIQGHAEGERKRGRRCGKLA